MVRRTPLGLTPCQEEALRLRCAGLQNTEVADRLFVSLQTVKNRMTLVYLTLGLTGHSADAAACYRLGLADAIRERGES